MAKTLVAFFSASGTTARVVSNVAKAVDGDLYEIEPAERYTAADLNWSDKQSRSSREMADDGCRPPIKGAIADMDAYDTVYLGFPVWWYVEPRIVDTFLEAYDFAGKTIISFATSGGSGIGGACERMRTVCPEATWKPGKLLNGGDVAAWAKSAR